MSLHHLLIRTSAYLGKPCLVMEGQDANVILNDIFQRLQVLETHQVATANASFRNKPPKPDVFYGTDDAKRVRQWVFQVDNYFTVTGEPEERRVSYATTLLRKSALLWWLSLRVEERPMAWAGFSSAIVDYFQPLSATIVARDVLARLYQKSSVKAYAEEFKAQVLNIPDVTDAEKLDRFRRGLKKDVRLHVAFANPPTFDQAVTIAEQIDEVLYAHRAYSGGAKTYGNAASTSRSNISPTAMEIGAIQSSDEHRGPYKKLTPEEKAELTRHNACFYCRKPGHVAIRCPAKKAAAENGPRRQ